MDLGVLVRHMNIILAIIAIPPSVCILKVLMKERGLLKTEKRELNKLLVILFSGVVLGALLNATLSILTLLGFGLQANKLSIYRSTYTSIFFSLVTWSIYLFQKGVSKKNKKK